MISADSNLLEIYYHQSSVGICVTVCAFKTKSYCHPIFRWQQPIQALYYKSQFQWMKWYPHKIWKQKAISFLHKKIKYSLHFEFLKPVTPKLKKHISLFQTRKTSVMLPHTVLPEVFCQNFFNFQLECSHTSGFQSVKVSKKKLWRRENEKLRWK